MAIFLPVTSVVQGTRASSRFVTGAEAAHAGGVEGIEGVEQPLHAPVLAVPGAVVVGEADGVDPGHFEAVEHRGIGDEGEGVNLGRRRDVRRKVAFEVGEREIVGVELARDLMEGVGVVAKGNHFDVDVAAGDDVADEGDAQHRLVALLIAEGIVPADREHVGAEIDLIERHDGDGARRVGELGDERLVVGDRRGWLRAFGHLTFERERCHRHLHTRSDFFPVGHLTAREPARHRSPLLRTRERAAT